MLGRFEFTTDLQYKVKHLQHEVDAFKSGDKYVKMNSNFQVSSMKPNRKPITNNREKAEKCLAGNRVMRDTVVKNKYRQK